MSKKYLIIIAGPTAVGKTELTVKLAKQLNTEIISADSRQFYRELSIGTAKPNELEMQGIKHHFIDSHAIQSYYSAGDYERDVLQLLEQKFKTSQALILTGGSGLFIKAISEGLDDMPPVDLSIRAQLMERLTHEGVEPLAQELNTLDPLYFNSVDVKNTQRVVRALEICLTTGLPYSFFRKNKSRALDFALIKIAIERPREELYARIDARVDSMQKAGLVAEVQSLINFRAHNALQTVGYKEVFDYLDSKITADEMIFLMKRNTRRYAKRQMTWFRNQDDFKWFSADDYKGILNYIASFEVV